MNMSEKGRPPPGAARPLITRELIKALAGQVSRRAVLVWVYLWASADRQTAEAWPSTATIAEAVGTNRNHVSEELQNLVSAGWLRTEQRAGRSSYFWVLCPLSVGCNQDGITPAAGCIQDGTPPVSTTGHTCIHHGTQNTTKNPRRNTRAGAFIPPTLQEVTAYCQEGGYEVDPEHFTDYYIARAWHLKGGEKMADWRATIRDWHRREQKYQGNGQQQPDEPCPEEDPYRRV